MECGRPTINGSKLRLSHQPARNFNLSSHSIDGLDAFEGEHLHITGMSLRKTHGHDESQNAAYGVWRSLDLVEANRGEFVASSFAAESQIAPPKTSREHQSYQDIQPTPW